MKKTLLALSVLGAFAMPPADAASTVGLDMNSAYLGGGLSRNSLSGFSDATGWQVFGGVDFAKVNPVIFGAEVGYMDAGNFDRTDCLPVLGCVTTRSGHIKGLWTTGIVRLPINPQFNVFARAGLDFGDDDGLMVGVGAGYKLNRQVELRGEYVDRDNVGSLQFNAAFYLNAH